LHAIAIKTTTAPNLQLRLHHVHAAVQRARTCTPGYTSQPKWQTITNDTKYNKFQQTITSLVKIQATYRWGCMMYILLYSVRASSLSSCIYAVVVLHMLSIRSHTAPTATAAYAIAQPSSDAPYAITNKTRSARKNLPLRLHHVHAAVQRASQCSPIVPRGLKAQHPLPMTAYALT
jgi:hypothetical protein